MQGGAKSTSRAQCITSPREQLLTPPVATGISKTQASMNKLPVIMKPLLKFGGDEACGMRSNSMRFKKQPECRGVRTGNSLELYFGH